MGPVEGAVLARLGLTEQL